MNSKVLVLGAGPAGLTAAYELTRRGVKTTVLEKDSAVGGIAKTVEYEGYRFDLGGHRFFTKYARVQAMWAELLGDELKLRPRLSRIYYRKRFYNYPIRPANVVWNLGLPQSALIAMSYLKARLSPYPDESSFEHYIVNRFGRRLFGTFFGPYTEKVWGVPCSSIRSDWAVQRIKDLSMSSLAKAALFGNRSKIRSLTDEFYYPLKGSGQMWEEVASQVQSGGGVVELDSEVTLVNMDGGRVVSVTASCGGSEAVWTADQFISTLPLRDLVLMMRPRPPPKVLDAAGRLRYRDFITVALIIDRSDMWPDNWIYIHDGGFKAGRIQNFKNWSPCMVPDPSKTCLGVEYFTFEGSELWNMADEDLVALAKKELDGLSLIGEGSMVLDGKVVRVRKAYPMYDMWYEENVNTIRGYLRGIPNLQTIGRNGMHRYNNQDHSMLTGMLAAENVSGAQHDVWAVNLAGDYHEEAVRPGVYTPSSVSDTIRRGGS
jgi:protoporphyrinogen oxidase